uniref:Inositol oxygenase n=1 Tax=Phallusia mammillata TaxID=59560 RepID=A0A6F9DLI5_9ASCI|nr:inositol oxygenase-like [Phallusia mammillata]
MASADVQNRVMENDIYKYRNDCDKPGFRNFSRESNKFDMVYKTYTDMHSNQCVEFVKRKHEEWLQFNHGKLTIMKAVNLLNTLIDESDPDVTFPNSFHAFQTAEGLRKMYPDLDWFHLTGLIHDLGKVMAIWGEAQFATVGDTFIVGAEFAPSIVYRDSTFAKNPDLHDPRYNTKYGMYEPNCGLENVLMSWGHDEYMYHVLRHNKCTLPEEALYCVRFHSFYPWHTGKDYDHLCNDKDRKMIEWVRKFNEHDLYTKSPDFPDVETLIPYYQSLIDKYLPGKLSF